VRKRTFVIAALAAICWSAAAAASADAAGTYVALGDSVAGGSNAPPGQGYVDRFFRHLQSPAGGGLDQLRNHSGTGSTESILANAGGQLAGVLADIRASSDTRVVSVEVGFADNADPRCDVAEGRGLNAPGCPFGPNFKAILGQVKAALAADPGDEQLIVATYGNPATGTAGEAARKLMLWGSDRRLDCAAGRRRLGLNDLITCIGLREGAAVADTYPGIERGGRRLISPDGLHPNGAGHAVIAQAFVAATRPTSLSALRIRPGSFGPTRSGRASSARAGATVSYSLSRADAVAFRVERRRGSRWVALGGAFTRWGEPGRNRFRFSGRVRGRTLETGRYRLVGKASGAARGSRPARSEFQITD
jgi:lysophospholipase L1-like esterase